MKIILHTEASDGWGGQEIRILSEIEGMQKRGHRCLLAAPPESQILKMAGHAGITVAAIRMDRCRWPSACLAIRHLIQKEGVSIINTHSSADSWIGAVAGHLSPMRPLLVRTRHIAVPISNRLTSRLLHHHFLDGIMTTSEEIRTEMIHRNRIRAERIISIPTGIDLSRFKPHPVKNGLKKKWDIPEKVPIVGTVGVLRSWKGHSFFIEAARRVLERRPDVVFVIVGEGPQYENIQRQIQKYSLQRQVKLVGYYPDVERAFAALDLVVLASTANEGVPQVILQALAMEKPVVATRVGGIPEVVRSGETGWLVPPGDPAAMAESILYYWSNPAEGLAMAQQGRCLVEREFSLERMLDRIEQFYDRLLVERAHA